VKRRVLAALPFVACAGAFADDDAAPTDPANESQPTLRGEIKAGVRLFSREYDGRFQQDVGLRDGPRLFDLDLVGSDPRQGAPVDEIETRFHGVGDANSDYLVSVKKRGSFDLEGGYRRDAYDYRASGDPFPNDSIRERTFVHALWTPDRSSALRLTWDGNDRRGYEQGFGLGTDSSGVQAARFEPRAFADRSDRFALGGDYALSIFRFGLTETIGLASVRESRAFGPADTTDYATRTKSYTTSAKAGASLAGGALDVTLFAVRTDAPMEERADVRASSPSATDEEFDGKLQRRQTTLRLEATWKPATDWEFTFAGERGELLDDENGEHVLNSVPPAAPPGTSMSTIVGDVRDRRQSWSADATWDASDKLRLRLGEQYLREELSVPSDSHFAPFGFTRDSDPPDDFSSNSWRTTTGADWRPSKKVSLSALAHFTVNDHPQTTAAPRDSDDFTLRGRANPSDEVALTTVWRRQTMDHSGAVPLDEIRNPRPFPLVPPRGTTDLDSTTRSSSVSQSAAWTKGPWSVRATGTLRRLDTRSNSAFYFKTGSGGSALEDVSFRGRDVIVDLDARYAVTKTLRVFADVVRSNARDAMETRTTTKSSLDKSHVSFPARRLDLSLGAEYDFGGEIETDGEKRRRMTAGLTLSTWRLEDGEASQDSYRVYGVEVSLAYRF